MDKPIEEKKILVITIFKDNFLECIQTLNSLYLSKIKFVILLKNGGSPLSRQQKISLEKYKKENEIHLIEKIDNGIYDAMNEALRYAKELALFKKSDWTWFLNSGDVLDFVPEKIDLQGLLGHTDAGIKFGEPSIGLEKEVGIAQKVDEFLYLSQIIRFNHQALLFHKNIFCEIGLYNDHLKVVGDFEFIHKTLKSNSFEYVDWLRIVVKPGGLSQSKSTAAEVERIKVILRLIISSRKIMYLKIVSERILSLVKHVLKQPFKLSIYR